MNALEKLRRARLSRAIKDKVASAPQKKDELEILRNSIKQGRPHHVDGIIIDRVAHSLLLLDRKIASYKHNTQRKQRLIAYRRMIPKMTRDEILDARLIMRSRSNGKHYKSYFDSWLRNLDRKFQHIAAFEMDDDEQ